MDIAEITARKNIQAALECFEQAVRIDPKCYDAWRSIGLIHKAQRSYVPAIKAYDRLPDVGDYGAKALGEIGVAMGAPVEAMQCTRRALALVRAEEHSRATGLGTDLEATIAQLEQSLTLKAAQEESRTGS
jgi:tetratricopeptide (TPR) repeat protein